MIMKRHSNFERRKSNAFWREMCDFSGEGQRGQVSPRFWKDIRLCLKFIESDSPLSAVFSQFFSSPPKLFAEHQDHTPYLILEMIYNINLLGLEICVIAWAGQSWQYQQWMSCSERLRKRRKSPENNWNWNPKDSHITNSNVNDLSVSVRAMSLWPLCPCPVISWLHLSIACH